MNCVPKGTPSGFIIPAGCDLICQGQKADRGHYEPEESAAVAFRQFTQERSFEDALVMTDIKGEVWPF